MHVGRSSKEKIFQVKSTLFRAILCIPGHSTGGCQTKQSITQIRSPQNPSRSPRAKAAVATSDASSGLPSRRLPRRERPVVPQHVVVALGDGDRGALEEVLLPPLGLPAATAALLFLLLLRVVLLLCPAEETCTGKGYRRRPKASGPMKIATKGTKGRRRRRRRPLENFALRALKASKKLKIFSACGERAPL